MKKNKEETFYHNTVFKVSALVMVIVAIGGALFPNGLSTYASLVSNFISGSFGWFYLLAVAGFVIFCLYLSFSKYGKIKLGHDHEKPEFSFAAWISMLFAAGFGAGIVFWGVAEPLTHFANPPTNDIEPQTAEAARVAMNYSFFNWGFHQWSVFTLVGLALAYFQFRKKSKLLISETLVGTKPQRNSVKKTVNILAVIATVTGVATSFGMGVLQINAGLDYVFSIPNKAWIPLAIIGVMCVLYMFSAITGLNKGIKILSNINMVLVFGFMVLFLFQGPTVFILESFVLALGDYFANFIEMSFYMTPYTDDQWVKNWTVFYWAWVITWSPFVGSFIARISKGRTIREFVIGVLVIPPAIGFVWIAIFGGTGIYLDLFENAAIANAVSADVTTAIFVLLEQFPLYGILSVLMLVLIAIFLITSVDSTVYVLGMMTSNGNENPSNLLKVIWGIFIAAITAVLTMSNGLQGVQTVSLITALPFTIIMIFIGISLFKSLHREQKGSQSVVVDSEVQQQKKAL